MTFKGKIGDGKSRTCLSFRLITERVASSPAQPENKALMRGPEVCPPGLMAECMMKG